MSYKCRSAEVKVDVVRLYRIKVKGALVSRRKKQERSKKRKIFREKKVVEQNGEENLEARRGVKFCPLGVK